uniref:Uncharacterized protein n=1 Tax=Labrus bergylta TaxID=56723 RepID=A0A3Q3GRX2_9LABR
MRFLSQQHIQQQYAASSSKLTLPYAACESLGPESASPLSTMGLSAFLGHCMLSFFIALFLDAAGFIIFLVGIFAPLSFWDFLIFTGSLIVFLSLPFWIFWYLGNLDLQSNILLPINVGLGCAMPGAAQSQDAKRKKEGPKSNSLANILLKTPTADQSRQRRQMLACTNVTDPTCM